MNGQPSHAGQPDPQFCREDYKLKVDYLSGQFQRMWTRFNLFLTLEVGLLAFLLTKGSGEVASSARYVAWVELAVSIIWLLVGMQDRCLVLIYRHHVRDAADQLIRLSLAAPDYKFVGEISTTLHTMRYTMRSSLSPKPLERIELATYFHVTRLAYVLPFIALLMWLIVLVKL